MDEKEILGKVQELVCYVLGNDDIVLTETTALQDDIDGWSSLAQAQILTAIEQDFDMRFSLDDIISMNTIGDIIIAIRTAKNE